MKSRPCDEQLKEEDETHETADGEVGKFRGAHRGHLSQQPGARKPRFRSPGGVFSQRAEAPADYPIDNFGPTGPDVSLGPPSWTIPMTGAQPGSPADGLSEKGQGLVQINGNIFPLTRRSPGRSGPVSSPKPKPRMTCREGTGERTPDGKPHEELALIARADGAAEGLACHRERMYRGRTADLIGETRLFSLIEKLLAATHSRPPIRSHGHPPVSATGTAIQQGRSQSPFHRVRRVHDRDVRKAHCYSEKCG